MTTQPASWGASDHRAFEDWVEANYPIEIALWETNYSHILDLWEYLERAEYHVLEDWFTSQVHAKK